MADVSSNDTAEYGKYLISQGHDPKEVNDYVAYLNSHHEVEPGPSMGDRLKGMARKTIDAGLPIAGAAAAGLVGAGAGAIEGAATGPGAVVASPALAATQGVAGAGLGWAAGKQLARILDQHLFGDETAGGESTLAGQAKQTLGDIKEGAQYDMGGKIVSAIPGAIKSGAQGIKDKMTSGLDYAPKPNAAEIQQSASEIGIDNVPKAVTSSNPTFQKYESGLSQSGSFASGDVRSQYNDFFKGVDKAADKIADLRTPQSDFAIGKSIKDDLADQISQSRKPVKELYDSITPDLQKIPVDPNVVSTQFGALKRNPIFQTKDGLEALEDAKQAVLQQPELNSLKEFRSTIHDSVGSTSAPIDAKRADAIYDAITKIRDNSINTMKTNLPASMHPEVDNVVDTLAQADAAHSANLKDINNIRAIVGGKNIKSATTFLNKLGDIEESDIAQRAANLDVSSMQNLKDTYPSVFDKAQAAKINDMVKSSIDPKNGFNINRFMKQYDALGAEEKDLIFDPKLQAHIENLQTLRSEIPEKLGPSGTPEGLLTMDKFNPKRNILDYGIKKSLDFAAKGNVNDIKLPTTAANSVSSVSELARPPISKAPAINEALQGPSYQSAAQSMPAAAQNEPQKGPEKWTNDGFNNLLQHVEDPREIQKLQQMREKMVTDPKTRVLLQQASELKPGSKAMQDIYKRIMARSPASEGQ